MVDTLTTAQLSWAAMQCDEFPGMDLTAQSKCMPKIIKSGIYTGKSGIPPTFDVEKSLKSLGLIGG